jgi:hypothetical protein
MSVKQKNARVLDSSVATPVRRVAEPELVSVAAAQDLTSISQHTWRSYAYRGIVSSVKIGDRLLIPMAEVRRIISKGYRPSLAEQREAARTA